MRVPVPDTTAHRQKHSIVYDQTLFALFDGNRTDYGKSFDILIIMEKQYSGHGKTSWRCFGVNSVDNLKEVRCQNVKQERQCFIGISEHRKRVENTTRSIVDEIRGV